MAKPNSSKKRPLTPANLSVGGKDIGFLHLEAISGVVNAKFKVPSTLATTVVSSAPGQGARARLAPVLILHLASEGRIAFVAHLDGDPRQKQALQIVHRQWLVQNQAGKVVLPESGGKELYLVPSKIQQGTKLCFVVYILGKDGLQHNSKLLHDRRLPLLLDLDLTLVKHSYVD